MKAIKNEETGLEFIVLDDKAAMLLQIKAAGVKMGPTSLSELLGGKRENVVGFKLVDVADAELKQAGQEDQGGGQADAGNQNQQGDNQNRREGDGQGQQNQGGEGDKGPGGGPKDQGFQNMEPEKQREIASEGGKHSHDGDPGRQEKVAEQGGNKAPEPIPGNQGGTTEQHQNAGAQSHKGDEGNGQENKGGQESGGQEPNQGDAQGQQAGGEEHPMRRATDKPQGDQPKPADAQGDKPTTPAPANNGTTGRKNFKSVQPKGKIKPVRSGTKIANGLEMLLKGTTQKELEDHEVSDDVFDFVNRRVTKRGYGVKVEGDKINLVLPEGVTKITYSNAAEGTAEEQAPKDKPIEEVKKETGGDQTDGDKATPAPDDKGDQGGDQPAPAADQPAPAADAQQ